MQLEKLKEDCEGLESWQGMLLIMEFEAKMKKRLNIHHIDYDKRNSNPINLITLCSSCHPKTNFGREKWKKLFQNFMQQESR